MATAADRAPLDAWRQRFWLCLAGGIFSLIVLRSISEWRESHALLINSSDSLPNWAFLIHRGQTPEKGDYVFFDPPQSALLRRHFGASPKIFGKIVYGMPGDVIGHVGSTVTINGKLSVRRKPRSRQGEPLTQGPEGPVPVGCYFVATPHRDGLDSRYGEIGFVCARQLVGIGTPIL